MKVTKQTTYSWDSVTNASELEAIALANQLLEITRSNKNIITRKFEFAPKETEIQANWYDAIAYCHSLRIDGKSGWRLPTNNELNEIYDSKNDFEDDWYWSSTEIDGNLAWNQNFSTGGKNDNFKNYGVNCVRAIRDI